MKLVGKAEDSAKKVLAAFESGSIGKAMADVFINWNSAKPCAKWSFNNRLIVALHGETDARGYRQWTEVGRQVKKDEKAINILAPIMGKTGKKDEQGKDILRLVGFKAIPVFGYGQTDGAELPGTAETENFIKGLPLVEVAQKWGIKVKTYNGQEGEAKGCIDINATEIALGVQNISTWAHELIHAADIKTGGYDKADYAAGEVVAEFGGAVLLLALGREADADLGGAWEYVKNWTKDNEGKHALSICMKLMGRICKAVEEIAKAAEEIHAAPAA